MSAWPQVVDRLVSYLPSLPGWSGIPVFDGPPVTGDAPSTFVTVGYVVGDEVGGSYEQLYSGGGLLEESGTVRCEVVAATGDVDLPTVRARAFALVDAWQAWVTSTPALGLPLSLSSALSVDVQSRQTDVDAVQRLTVTLSYSAIS